MASGTMMLVAAAQIEFQKSPEEIRDLHIANSARGTQLRSPSYQEYWPQDPFLRSASRPVLLGCELDGGMRLEAPRQQFHPDAFSIICEAEQIEVDGIHHS